jgi:muramoyltetrapeptide carboxypeptidase
MKGSLAVPVAALAAWLAATPGGGTEEEPRRAALKPPALVQGDLIAIAAPAGPLHENTLRVAAENLERRGYAVKVAGAAAKRGYLAGSDEARAGALNALIRDPSVRAIVCARGGYGSPRLLDRIDYEALRKDPKVIVGYSDITALLIAVERKAGVVAFHGPMGREWSLGRGPSNFSEKFFWPAFATASPLFANWGGERAPGMKTPVTIVPGAAEGVLTGGNLSVLCSLLGTPYEVDARGAILFLEEVSEKTFRIDRMLNQLRLAGKLAQARGILLGGFTGCDVRDPEGDLPLAVVFADYLGGLGIPVLAEFPAGHVPDQATLPLGVRVRLDSGARTLAILESPTAARGGAEADGSR